jgi:hypothetical protein
MSQIGDFMAASLFVWFFGFFDFLFDFLAPIGVLRGLQLWRMHLRQAAQAPLQLALCRFRWKVN